MVGAGERVDSNCLIVLFGRATVLMQRFSEDPSLVLQCARRMLGDWPS